MASQVGVPYLRAKAQDYYEELGGGVNSDVLDEGLDARQVRALTDAVRLPPYLEEFHFKHASILIRHSRASCGEASKQCTHG